VPAAISLLLYRQQHFRLRVGGPHTRSRTRPPALGEHARRAASPPVHFQEKEAQVPAAQHCHAGATSAKVMATLLEAGLPRLDPAPSRIGARHQLCLIYGAQGPRLPASSGHAGQEQVVQQTGKQQSACSEEGK
jgi:hypothetical protein